MSTDSPEPMNETQQPKRTIGITQADSKRVLALTAHMRRLYETVLDKDGKGRHPLMMDQGELLLCAASLRTLLFDDSPSPILTDFLTQHAIDVEMETFETDISMIFFAQVEPMDKGHACDLCLNILFDKEMREYCELDKEKTLMLFMNGPNETYSDLARQPHVWRPTKEESEKLNTSVGFSNLGGPSQMITVLRKRVNLAEWGKVRLGYLKGIPIRRKNIISYVANKLGGVHYDSTRLPANKNDRAEFKILAQAYDWEKQAIMHAGLVLVAIACIEIVMHPQIRELLHMLQTFESKRLIRLLRGESVV